MKLRYKRISCRISLMLIFGFMLMTVTGTVAGTPSGLVLWNKLGSDDEVLNSAFGPDLEFYTGGGDWPDGIANRKYVLGKFGNGVTIDNSDYYSMQRIRNIVLKDLPSYIYPEQGTVEVWYYQKAEPVPYEYGIYRLFDGGYGLGSGMGLSAFSYVEMGCPTSSCIGLALAFGGTSRWILYPNNLPNNQWIHVAAVWDRNGIDGTSETMRLYIDGNKVASGTDNDWGTSVGYWADICGGNDNDIADKFAMDNLKIWNYAKIDFSDRFVEGIGIPATIDIDPNTLSLKSKGNWITDYIELPEDYDVNDINASTIRLEPGEIPVDPTAPATIGDYDSDGISDLMVKFNRANVAANLVAGNEVKLTVTGKLNDETEFEGNDTIRVIK